MSTEGSKSLVCVERVALLLVGSKQSVCPCRLAVLPPDTRQGSLHRVGLRLQELGEHSQLLHLSQPLQASQLRSYRSSRCGGHRSHARRCWHTRSSRAYRNIGTPSKSCILGFRLPNRHILVLRVEPQYFVCHVRLSLTEHVSQLSTVWIGQDSSRTPAPQGVSNAKIGSRT